MSTSGSQPDPAGPQPGQPSPYGGAQPSAYGGGAPTAYGAPGAGQAPTYPYASWIQRVGAALVDGLLGVLVQVPYIVGIVLAVVSLDTTTSGVDTEAGGYSTTETTVGSPALLTVGLVLVVVGLLAVLAFFVWNTVVRAGRTGWSIGKGVVGIRLVGEATGQPIGAGLAFVRVIAHVLDGLCYIGYLWPLWDAKRQTFADKIMGTVVVRQARPS